MDLLKLNVTPVTRHEEPRFRALMDEHHYLGAPSKIGQTVRHAADDGSGEWSALAAVSAGALKCSARDAWTGWGRREQFGRLPLIASSVRLLLRGRRPNLGSRLLAHQRRLAGAPSSSAAAPGSFDIGLLLQIAERQLHGKSHQDRGRVAEQQTGKPARGQPQREQARQSQQRHRISRGTHASRPEFAEPRFRETQHEASRPGRVERDVWPGTPRPRSWQGHDRPAPANVLVTKDG